MIKIAKNTSIVEEEITYTFARSAGPGGQNVNKLNTKVTAVFNVADCENLTPYQKKRILSRLRTRTTKDGFLKATSQKHRTQKANRITAHGRLIELLIDALKKQKPRKKTTIPRYAKEKRLAEKKRRGAIKKLRQEKDFED
ncbi:MAG: alternative ribosome rescue aminoacyl-tRNA hydrolase ArfB [Planctomycetota bacterium]|jgi:ribosome-associated protein